MSTPATAEAFLPRGKSSSKKILLIKPWKLTDVGEWFKAGIGRRTRNDKAVIERSVTPLIEANQGLKAGAAQISRASVSAADDESKEDESQYPTTWIATTITLGICLVSFATAVDNTIISS